jgi:hypothetical protein
VAKADNGVPHIRHADVSAGGSRLCIAIGATQHPPQNTPSDAKKKETPVTVTATKGHHGGNRGTFRC